MVRRAKLMHSPQQARSVQTPRPLFSFILFHPKGNLPRCGMQNPFSRNPRNIKQRTAQKVTQVLKAHQKKPDPSEDSYFLDPLEMCALLPVEAEIFSFRRPKFSSQTPRDTQTLRLIRASTLVLRLADFNVRFQLHHQQDSDNVVRHKNWWRSVFLITALQFNEMVSRKVEFQPFWMTRISFAGK